MADIITLDEADLRPAITVLGHGIGEIPLYQWLLGDHIDDPDKREWLAELLLRPLLRVGCAAGAFDEGRLVGVIAWQPHDVEMAPDGTPPLTPADVQVAARTPGLRERLLELWTGEPLPSPAPDAVNCFVVAVLPDGRRGRTLIDLMRPIETFCRTRNRPFYAWTGSPALQQWFVRGWNTTSLGTIEWNGIPMYGVVSDRPPAQHTIPPGRDNR